MLTVESNSGSIGEVDYDSSVVFVVLHAHIWVSRVSVYFHPPTSDPSYLKF